MPSFDDFCSSHREDFRRLEERFRGYRVGIDRYDIREWMLQFKSEHYDLALRLLNTINYYDQARVIGEAKILFSQLQKMKENAPQDMCFASFSPPGHSGDTLLSYYRDGSGLRQHRYDPHFINISDLSSDDFSQPVRTFVLIDDFIGSGRQALDRWENIQGVFYEKDVEDIFLSILVGYEDSIQAIERRTDMSVICNLRLTDRDKIFSIQNSIFTTEEKASIREYCNNTGDTWPLGYSDCQSNVVFFYRAPNNTISILRCNRPPSWRGLFLRY